MESRLLLRAEPRVTYNKREGLPDILGVKSVSLDSFVIGAGYSEGKRGNLMRKSLHF